MTYTFLCFHFSISWKLFSLEASYYGPDPAALPHLSTSYSQEVSSSINISGAILVTGLSPQCVNLKGIFDILLINNAKILVLSGEANGFINILWFLTE